MPERILIVDPSEADRRGLIAILSGLGDFEFVEAASGLEAMRILKIRRFDLVFLEWNLPLISGLVVVQRMQAMWLRTPVVMVSARSRRCDVVEAIAAGVAHYVVKAFDAAAIARSLACIRPAMGRSDGAQNASKSRATPAFGMLPAS